MAAGVDAPLGSLQPEPLSQPLSTCGAIRTSSPATKPPPPPHELLGCYTVYTILQKQAAPTYYMLWAVSCLWNY